MPSLAPSVYDLELECPPMPQTLLEAIDLMNSPDVPDPDRVTQMVQHDPAAVARLLRVVNSAYFARRARISDVRHAVVVLGPAQVVGVVMSMGMMSMKSGFDEHTTLPFLNLVRHSIATAFLSRRLVERIPGVVAMDARNQAVGEAYTAGLMHDFGKLVLLYNHPEKAVAFYAEQPEGDDDAWLAHEAEALGVDHARAGVFIAPRLKFSEHLTGAIAQHHQYAALESEDAATRRLVYIVTAANKAASAMGFAFNDPSDMATCAAHPIWDLLVEASAYGSREEALDVVKGATDDLQAYVDAVV